LSHSRPDYGVGGDQGGPLTNGATHTGEILLETDGHMPDGRWLVYQSDELGQPEVFVQPFPNVTQGVWRISTAGGRQPKWARNGRELFYLAPDGAIMSAGIEVAPGVASIEPRTPVLLVKGEGYFTGVANQLGRTWDVSADGTRFLRIKPTNTPDLSDAPPELVVVQHWLDEFKEKLTAP